MRKIFSSLIFVFLISCGNSVVELEDTFEPKLVIQAFIFPGSKVSQIQITRNFPLNRDPKPTNMIVKDAIVTITDLSSNKEYDLTFNYETLKYEYAGSDFIIDYDREYQLKVVGTNLGKTISVIAKTKTPKKGFSIIKEKTISGNIFYRQKNENGEIKNLPLMFKLSHGITFYPISIVALDAKEENFIYENAYREVSKDDVIKNLDNYKYRQRQIFNVNPYGDFYQYEIPWTSIWFYGNYRMIVYAADENYRLFSLSYKNVQEFDGNFHEPKVTLQGDGIGVFASMIADTVYFNVIKN